MEQNSGVSMTAHIMPYLSAMLIGLKLLALGSSKQVVSDLSINSKKRDIDDLESSTGTISTMCITF